MRPSAAIVAIIELSMFLSFKHNFYHIVPSLMLSKLYSNSLLVLLNNRLTISYRRDSEFTGSEISGRSRGEVETQRSRGGGMIQVTIDRETYNENIAMVKLQDQRVSCPSIGSQHDRSADHTEPDGGGLGLQQTPCRRSSMNDPYA